MNLELNLMDKYSKLRNRNWEIDQTILIRQIAKTFKVTDIVTKLFISGELTGFEKKDEIAKLNPLLWEFGHILFFWEKMTIQNLGGTSNTAKGEFYDSFRVNRDMRFGIKEKLLNLDKINLGLGNVINFIKNYISKYKLNNISMYLIRLSQLHQEMHNESFIFTHQLLEKKLFKIPEIKIYEPHLYTIEMIDVMPGTFKQGVSIYSSEFFFDNEAPSFIQSISSFKVSKYCITNYQYLQFVEDGGYEKEEYWLPEGWNWLQSKKLLNPIYWFKIKNMWFEKIWNTSIPLRKNNPVIHISWYEAKAFCNWKNVRLLKESEWEYISKLNNTNEELLNAHLNYGEDYNINSTISVQDDKSKNLLGIVGLYGNCWEWCEEPIYPYDGFVIDPIYREMSYPFFGYKRICRGGSWAVPDFLINSHYRNAQPPDCIHQFIGFRVADI